MRAIVVDRLMEPSDARVHEIPEPELAPGQLRVDVHAAGCNFFDILQMQGRYQVKPALPFTPGAELAGIVRDVGDGVSGFAPGDRVFGSTGLGAFAEVASAPATSFWKLPDAMSFAEGAALPVIYPTSYAALVFRTQVVPGETLLVHAAAGGVGLAAVQIGKALGARVIGTAGGAEKCEIALRHGAEAAIDYRADDFVERVLELTDGKGADIIYDSVGGITTDRSLKCIAWDGRLLVIGFASGDIPSVKLNRVLLKNIAIIGLHWGAHAKYDPEKIDQTMRGLLELYEKGQIAPAIYGTYPLDEVAAALEALGSRRTWGKVIVAP